MKKNVVRQCLVAGVNGVILGTTSMEAATQILDASAARRSRETLMHTAAPESARTVNSRGRALFREPRQQAEGRARVIRAQQR